MRQYITNDQLNSLHPSLKENLIRLAGMNIQYKNDPNQVNKLFTIGKLIALVNNHIDNRYHIDTISHDDFGWQIDSYIYTKKCKELIDALWDAFVWCYDDELRKLEFKKETEVWKIPEERVDIKLRGDLWQE